jgi:Phage integrase family
VRRRFAPHQLRHAHAVELAREGVAINIIQRQLAHSDLGTTSTNLQGIDPSEIIDAVHSHRQPTISATARRPGGGIESLSRTAAATANRPGSGSRSAAARSDSNDHVVAAATLQKSGRHVGDRCCSIKAELRLLMRVGLVSLLAVVIGRLRNFEGGRTL